MDLFGEESVMRDLRRAATGNPLNEEVELKHIKSDTMRTASRRWKCLSFSTKLSTVQLSKSFLRMIRKILLDLLFFRRSWSNTVH